MIALTRAVPTRRTPRTPLGPNARQYCLHAKPVAAEAEARMAGLRAKASSADELRAYIEAADRWALTVGEVNAFARAHFRIHNPA